MNTIAPITELQAETELLDNIQAGNLTKVVEFVTNYPLLRLCYGNRQVCALEYSIDCRKFDIYAYLRSKGFYTEKGDELNTKIQNLSPSCKDKIRDENLKHVVCNPEACIGIILSKCSFDPRSPIASTDVREMLLKFKEIDEINSTFPTIAHADFKTIFDYENESVQAMDPNGDEFTLGLAYFEKGILFVSKNAIKNQRYGTFAHEMMHFVYFLIYENKCLPYCKGDIERKAEWDEVVKKVKEQYENNKETTDNIIKWVFLYYAAGYEQSAETAVRVNDMLAFHHDNQAKIVELEGLHPELFSYIRTKVLPDLKIPNVYRMIKLNNDFGLLQKIEDSELQVKPTDKSEILDLVTENSKRVLIVTNVPKLMLSKINNEIKNLPGNKLNLKARNIFVDAKMLEQKHVKEEFEALVETTTVDRIIADSSNPKDLVNDLKPNVQLFFIATEEFEENPNLKRHQVNIQWQDLTEKSQNFLLKKPIKFQDSPTNLSQVLLDVENSIMPEILTILCSDNEIKVNCDSKVEKLTKFINRTVQMKKKVKMSDDSMKQGLEFDQENEEVDDPDHQETSRGSKTKKVKFALVHEDLFLEDFIEKTQNEQILIISDMAGSGKTTLLIKIHEILINKYPKPFIIFIPLLKYVEELTEGVGENFPDFIAKAVKFNELEREIFVQKYKKGEVKVLFDAFDEISPKCKDNTTRLFQNFLINDKNQIFLTTRTHLEHDLEKNLKVLAHRIKNLSEEEQVKFVVEYWENENQELVQKSAKKLIKKISEIISSNPSFIGVPLIVQGLAEVYKDKIDENFEREIENLDISSVYDKIVENFFAKFKIWCLQNNPKIIENMSPLQIHQFFAFCFFFSEELANLLGLTRDEGEWSNEEVARCGLVKYDKNGKFHFNHQTNAEHFIAGFTFNLLKTVKKLSSVNLDLIFQILNDEKFQITRKFLDTMLNNVENIKNLKSFNSSQEICEKVKNEKNFLQLCVREKLFNIFEFFALTIKEGDVRLFKEIIELKDEYETTNLMLILPHATNHTKFEKFLSEILNFYSENIFDDFLLKINKYGDTILHYFARSCKNQQIFDCFWDKIKVFFTDEAQLKSFLLTKGNLGRNALLMSIAQQNENSFNFLFEQVFRKIFNIKEFAYESDDNLLHYLVRFGSVSMLKIATEKLKNDFSPEDFQNFIKLKSKNGDNLLHCAAAQNKDENSVEFLVKFIENEVGIEEVKNMLSVLNFLKRLPLHCAVLFNNFKVFELFFSLYEENFHKVQILQFLSEKVVDGDNLLHHAAGFARSKEIFVFLWRKVEELFEDREELKKFLLVKGFNERNALLRSIEQQNENTFYFLFEQFICTLYEIKEFAYEIEENGENLLHFLARFGSVSMLKFATEKLKNEFSHEELQNFIKLKSKEGRNLLHCAALENKDENLLEFLVNFIKNEVGSEEVKKMLSEPENVNALPLHCAVAFSNLKVFEFFFQFYVKSFTKNEIMNFVEQKVDNQSMFELARQYQKNVEMIEAVELAFAKFISGVES